MKVSPSLHQRAPTLIAPFRRSQVLFALFIACSFPVSYYIVFREAGDCGPFAPRQFWLDQLDAVVATTTAGFQDIWAFVFSVR